MKTDPQPIFDRLKQIAIERAPGMIPFVDKPGDYVNESPHKRGEHEFFAAVKIKKTYVSFHLLPVYMHPPLLDGLSPDLKKRMQGKSCFNFKSYDEALFEQLADLVERAANYFAERDSAKP